MKKIIFCLFCITFWSCKKSYTEKKVITVTSPSFGQIYKAGGIVEIKWQTTDVPAQYKILVMAKYSSGQIAKDLSITLAPVLNPIESSMGKVSENNGGGSYILPLPSSLEGRYLYGEGKYLDSTNFVVQIFIGKVLRNGKWLPEREFSSAESPTFTILR